MCWPPLIDNVEPVMKPASSETRKRTPRAISSALPRRPTGTLAMIFSSTAGGTARTKEMLYLAVSMSNSCDYCTVSHTAAARKAGMTDAMLHELIAIVGMANETNRLVGAYRVEPDEKLVEAAKGPKG